MVADRTLITELATGLGMISGTTLRTLLAGRPAELVNVPDTDWVRLRELWQEGAGHPEFKAGFENGRAFLQAAEALNGRSPRIIEWTGGRRPPGDEVVPSDLRIDHVYLVSCKYLSRILHNVSPARLIDALLSQEEVQDTRDWFARTAPEEYQELYEACIQHLGFTAFPDDPGTLEKPQRRRMATSLRGKWPPHLQDRYSALSRRVSHVSAELLSSRLNERTQEALLWRLLRIGSAPYFVLGADRKGSMRLRIDTPWDWRQSFELQELHVRPQEGGQPRIGWAASYLEVDSEAFRKVEGHVELRWSHGRFGQPPEAKIYVDTEHAQIPGYNELKSWTAPKLFDD